MVLLGLKKRDEKNPDLWLLKYVAVLALGLSCGYLIARFLG